MPRGKRVKKRKRRILFETEDNLRDITQKSQKDGNGGTKEKEEKGNGNGKK